MPHAPFAGHIGRTVAESRPWWPPGPGGRSEEVKRPNVLVVLFDDVGFADFGCYGSTIRTPTIDALAARGVRLTGFHTTAMCSTTRAALMTGCNHHSVGMGCLANFDSGYPGYRGKIAPEAATLAEMLRPAGYVNYMVGKWHVTPLSETGPTGPFDGWPLGRGYDRFYGFMDAETDQYAPELVRDNTPVAPPGGFDTGYHLSADLVDQSIRCLSEHAADRPERPWHLWLAPGACHAPHQAPAGLIHGYDAMFAHGWDVERERRLARQVELGLVPAGTTLPPRNDGVMAWDSLPPPGRALATRLQSAYAAMLDHFDQQLARLVAFLETSGQLDDTLICVLSDNGASQEGGPIGMVNAMGPYNLRPEMPPEKVARIDDIGGPATHSNFPWGWAMCANTPLKRYKQNTHGGGIRDPLVVSWPSGLAARGELRHGFRHAVDFVPTLLDLLKLKAPAQQAGRTCLPLEGESFAALLRDAGAPPRARPQYFEMFGHRGLWHAGWKAVAFHPRGRPFDDDVWELYHLDEDFAENHDLSAAEPERLAALVHTWWREAERCQVLPLDDRFGERFAENGRRVQGARTQFVLHAGMGHLPTDVAPDLRSRDYRIEADVRVPETGCEGVLIAHGDATSGYSLYVQGGHLVHDLNVGGEHQLLRSERPLRPGRQRLGVTVTLGPWVERQMPVGGSFRVPVHREVTLTFDDEAVGRRQCPHGFNTLTSWSGLDIGLDRGSPVSHYAAPFEFTGRLFKVSVALGPMTSAQAEAKAGAELARQ
ncbi:MAG: arylsulfatase [Rubrivivax sp.]|nr:arylsulfatase [Rubrivivax sp.]